eukprot:2710822-Rhodomonas_salina.1
MGETTERGVGCGGRGRVEEGADSDPVTQAMSSTLTLPWELKRAATMRFLTTAKGSSMETARRA